ncbi:MauE/DoxX family redox-associated membrane protein [Polluticoccus soli]|uniref:MauE/DoxX family redox-associated membrane protein n=1 Tax=Polluticoccus soli TaxID=3034150 RepID=UPI0023E2140E|nr:MauE/DoxX family redox-associated membrane protein [Flavipsychrobacter sp. JY13-12]
MKILKQTALVLLSIALGATFLYSAWTKLYNYPALEKFEWTIVQFAGLSWRVAELSARFFGGLEIALGSLLIFNSFGRKKWVPKLAIALLLIFSAYLVFLWVTVGNNINCGCFGDEILMSPSASLLKNVALIALLLVIAKFHQGLRFNWLRFVNPLIFLILCALPFIFYPIPESKPQWLQKDSFELNLAPLYDTTLSKPVAPVQLKQGKHVIAFLSLSCPHCRMAAKKMHIMKLRNPSLPFYFVVAGKDQYMEPFWKETEASNVPYTKLDGDAFTNMIGYSWPVIYWINTGKVEAQTKYIELDQHEIEKWLVK